MEIIIICIMIVLCVLIITMKAGGKKEEGKEDCNKSSLKGTGNFYKTQQETEIEHTIVTVFSKKEYMFWVCRNCETENPFSENRCCVCSYKK